MAKKERTVRYTSDEISGMLANGEDRTNWAKAGAVTDEELAASIAADPDEAGMVIDWASASPVTPEPKTVLHMRVDRDVMAFFRGQGKGYQTKINAVLRAYVEQMTRHQRP